MAGGEKEESTSSPTDVEVTDVLPPVPRENLISTAVKFLSSPKVRESPFSQRKSFLEKKGLTAEEIELAIERSGTAGDEHIQYASPVSHQMPALHPPAVQPVPVSKWYRARDYAATAIVTGGVAYAVYMIYRKYIQPYLYGPSKEEKLLQSIQTSIAELQKNMADTLQSIQDTQKQQIITERPRPDNSDIKEEIKSLKGLLLSRKQFPPAPVTTPVLPAWQLSTNAPTKPTPTAPIESAGAENGIAETTVSPAVVAAETTASAVMSASPAIVSAPETTSPAATAATANPITSETDSPSPPVSAEIVPPTPLETAPSAGSAANALPAEGTVSEAEVVAAKPSVAATVDESSAQQQEQEEQQQVMASDEKPEEQSLPSVDNQDQTITNHVQHVAGIDEVADMKPMPSSEATNVLGANAPTESQENS